MPLKYGLIGYPLSHSFSKGYFAQKFESEGVENVVYDNYPLEEIGLLPDLLRSDPALIGLNVTIPYKQKVMQFVDWLADDAGQIQAVNTLKRSPNGILKGYNTDIFGFRETLKRFIPPSFSSGALILGTGGASKAVKYVCEELGLNVQYVSRRKSEDAITYESLDRARLNDHKLIVNCTPLGMYPKVESYPDLKYKEFGTDFYLLDLVYNPAETEFLRRGRDVGCHFKNGMEMLVLQAERSWAIWNDPLC